MGRSRRYRERIEAETRSVAVKGVSAVIARALRTEFGRSRMEAEALAARSVAWLPALGVGLAPGRATLSVPATASRRWARERRRMATLSLVDVERDTEAWRRWGLPALQRARAVRWLLEVHRQGGWASLSEVAAWANLTPTALSSRLRPLREVGVWLPHVGGPAASDAAWGVEAWLLGRHLGGGDLAAALELAGYGDAAWRGVLEAAARMMALHEAGTEPEEIAGVVGRSVREVREGLRVVADHGGLDLPAVSALPPSQARGEEIEGELVERFGFSRVAAGLYRAWLARLAGELAAPGAGEGELTFFAIDAGEGARAKLTEAKLVPVRLTFITDADLALGPRGLVPTRVAEMKFARIERLARQAREQGALLTLPDLAVLLGMHVDAIRHHLAEHPDVLVPTRGRVKDIGRGVSHKTWIVELYLQMHSESEIVERTQHAYESVEAYLREFARVLILADRGMNAVMIRRVTHRSMSLVNGYLELYRRYDRPEHHFRLSQLRDAFTREDLLGGEKGGHHRASRTGDGTP
ncbi:MAG: DUF1670 domain-containing protein [Trueperaceae bacterium]|nr:DUF1670 domain-containing protein [Trueperaceae bacterium]